jgi:EAL domain-containing protein (putative c-di-GMP-specific phosphodiesterase class I)
MLRNIALLGQSLRLKVIAEGVETEEQVMLALGAGCSIMQGYLVSRPMRAKDVNQFISKYANQNSGEYIYET